MKFGGTSVAGADRLQKVAELVIEQSLTQPVLVVVSAFRGVTDALVEIAYTAAEGEHWENQWKQLADRHLEVIDQLGSIPCSSISPLLDELHRFCTGIARLGECTPRMLDTIAGYGELLSSRLLEAYLRTLGIDTGWHDARCSIKTDAHYTAASLDWHATAAAVRTELLPRFEQYRIIVTQGFIGSTPNGIPTTLGRGGSDYSAAIFGAALNAERVEIWTDVSGILTADPRIVPDALTLPVMTIGEVASLAAYGAKVLHPLTIMPAIEHDVPVVVRNTFAPSHPGTTIVASLPTVQPGIRAVVSGEAWIGDDVPQAEETVLARVRLRRSAYHIATVSLDDRSRAVATFCCVGAAIHHGGAALEQLAEAARELDCTVQVAASSDECILALVEQCYGRAFLLALHQKIRSRLMEVVP